jgi:hypothetical protein
VAAERRRRAGPRLAATVTVVGTSVRQPADGVDQPPVPDGAAGGALRTRPAGFVSTADAAALLGVARTQVVRWLDDGVLGYVPGFGGVRWVAEADVVALLAEVAAGRPLPAGGALGGARGGPPAGGHRRPRRRQGGPAGGPAGGPRG